MVVSDHPPTDVKSSSFSMSYMIEENEKFVSLHESVERIQL